MTELAEELKNDVLTPEGITEKDQAFLDVLFDECGGNVREAMTKVGYARSVPTSFVTKRLGKQIKDRAKEYITGSTAQAAITMVKALTDGNIPGLKNTISAAKEILDRGGVNKEEETQKTVERNIFILPAIVVDSDD